MNTKRVLLILLITVAILASVSVVSAGFLDGLFGEQQKDNVIEVDGISFNTTNATDFKENKSFSKQISNDYGKSIAYCNDNGTGDYCVGIIGYDGLGNSDEIDQQVGQGMRDASQSTPYQTINGVVVYTGSKVSGMNVGKPVHYTYVQNGDLDKIVMLASPDANETAKMALSLKFK